MSTGYTISDFTKGQKVIFGRGNGEQTEGTVMKVNRTKLKIRQDESRGTMRSYPIGTIWTVPPSLCRPADPKAAPAPSAPARPAFTRQSPRDALAAKGIRTGDRVEFTFRGRRYEGTIRRINQKRVTIEDVNDPRLSAGVYANPSSILRKVDAKPVDAVNVRVGQAVEYVGNGFDWNTGRRYTGPTKSVVTRVNASAGTVEVFDGFTTTVKASEVTPVTRTETEIMQDIQSAYCGLSPENLTCDGEASRSHVRNMAALYNRALKALFIEIGREVGEGESYYALQADKRASK